MQEYSTEQLKSLVSSLRNQSDDSDKQFEITESHWDLIRFLETTCFDPMTFEDWVEMNEDYLPVFSEETEDLPLLINMEDVRFEPIIQWRLNNGI